MTRLIVDSELRAKLGGFQDLVEFCDESGRVVGFFHPSAPVGDGLNRQTTSPISDEDIEIARRQRTGRSLTEILADLDRQP
jgi:hypothetical protein